VEGVRSLEEAVSSTFEILEVYYVREILDDPAAAGLLARLRARTGMVREATQREIASVSDTVSPQGIVAVLKQKPFDMTSLLDTKGTESILVALDGLTDPGNLGSIIRTCDWFGVHGVLVGQGSVDVYNPKVIRGTMGGIFHLPVAGGIDLPAALTRARDSGYRIYVTDVGGGTFFDRVTYERRSVIVFGNEARGVSDQLKKLADARVSIRKYGAAESLNAGVACGIVLSALHRLSSE
jgi:TrmH family RNA methyltransferase